MTYSKEQYNFAEEDLKKAEMGLSSDEKKRILEHDPLEEDNNFLGIKLGSKDFCGIRFCSGREVKYDEARAKIDSLYKEAWSEAFALNQEYENLKNQAEESDRQAKLAREKAVEAESKLLFFEKEKLESSANN